MKRKILTYLMRIIKYVLKAVLDRLRKDVGGKEESKK